MRLHMIAIITIYLCSGNKKEGIEDAESLNWHVKESIDSCKACNVVQASMVSFAGIPYL